MTTAMRTLDALLDLQRSIESSLRSGWFGFATTGFGTFPSINVFRDGHDFVLLAELPDANKAALQIDVMGREIRIRATKTVEIAEDASVHRRERRAGAFDGSVAIPAQIDAEGVRADYRDGLLAVHLPRAQTDRPRSIRIS